MNKTVLIVEDELELRELLADTLKTNGYSVFEASNGQEAIDFLRNTQSTQPNMILMDLMMPGMDGWAFRSEMLSDPLLAYIPIVVISGNSNVTRVAHSMRAIAHLAKPFSMEHLVETVEAHWLDDSIQQQHRQDVIQTMATMVHRLARLIASLLEQAPFVDDRLVVKIQQIDIQHLITQLADHYRDQALQNDTELSVSIQQNITPLFGDPEIINLIINNLIEDALNSMIGGEIKLSVYTNQGAHYIAVQNSGEIHTSTTLVDPPQENAQTTTHSQNKTRKRNQRTAPSVGIGLTLIREILASIKGYLELQNNPRGGNTFTLVLPELNQAQHVQAH